MGRYSFVDAERPMLTELTEKIKKNPNGDIDFFGNGNRNIRELPENLVVPGRLVLKKCKNLTHLPKGLVAEHLDLSESGIVTLPSDIIVRGSTNLFGCKKLKSLPDNLSVGYELDLRNCENLSKLPIGLKHCNLLLRGCYSIKELPHDYMQCDYFVTDWGYSGLEILPEGFISNSQTLRLDGCKNLKRLPDNMIVNGNLDLSYSGIEKIPHGLRVSGGLCLKGCDMLTEIPDDLIVEGRLITD